MRKILLLSVILTLSFSCTKEDEKVVIIKEVAPVVVTCNVEKYLEIRRVTYNPMTGVIISDTGFVENGYKVPYSNNWDDCNKEIGVRTETNSGGVITTLRYIAKCK